MTCEGVDEAMREEIDVVGCSPTPSLPNSESSEDLDHVENVFDINEDEKKYYCQRCLNHGLHYPRKGHKPNCRYLDCVCEDCHMVEERRQLNNMLSRKKIQTEPRDTTKGPRIRDPQCARCGAHGVKIPLRGHKRSMCQFSSCQCSLCDLVETRRSLMAKQIKLRRDQQKVRGNVKPKVKKVARCRSSSDNTDSVGSPVSDMAISPSSPFFHSPNAQFTPPTNSNPNSVATSTCSLPVAPQLFFPSPQPMPTNQIGMFNNILTPNPPINMANQFFPLPIAPQPPALAGFTIQQYQLLLQLLTATATRPL